MPFDHTQNPTYEIDLVECLGLTGLCEKIWERNDGCTAKGIEPHTFAEIADWLESL